MFGAPWICRRCINTYLRPNKQRLLRFASTSKSKYVSIGDLQLTSKTASHGSFSPVLLERARNMAKEHDRLTEETAETFDAKIAKRIGELKNVTTALREWEESESALKE